MSIQFTGPLIATLLLATAAFAGEITIERDVEFGNAAGKRLLLDVHRPADAAAEPRAAIMFIHGGGWVGGDKRDMHSWAENAAKAGFVCFNVNYRLAFPPLSVWPAQLDDVQRSVRWVRANAAKYSVNPARIGAVGASAGGHLAVFLGTTDTRDNSDPVLAAFSSRVACVVNVFGPTDLTEDFADKVKAGLAANGMIASLLGGSQLDKKDAARDASPLWRVDKKSAPFLTWHGRLDPLVHPDQSERLDAALKNAGIESTLVIFEDEAHGWQKKPNADRFARETMDFLKKHLSKK